MILLKLHQINILLQVSGLTSGRTATILPMLLGLISVILVITTRYNVANQYSTKRNKALIAIVAGLISIVLAGIHLARASGDFGTGSGKLGAIVALLLAGIGVVSAVMILSRNNKNVN
jgi:membrane protein CcdC involved in cytochrome C biogenesis